MVLEVSGATLSGPDVQGAGQRVAGSTVELTDPRSLTPRPRGGEDLEPFLKAEALIESDDPDIRAEAERTLRGVVGVRARAERLTRHVNAILEKKPTVSLPSAPVVPAPSTIRPTSVPSSSATHMSVRPTTSSLIQRRTSRSSCTIGTSASA